MKHGIRGLLVAFALIAVGASSSYAQGPSCGQESVLIPDGSEVSAFIGAGATNQTWGFYYEANRTYVIEVLGFGEAFNDLDIEIAPCAAIPAGWLYTDRTGTEPKAEGFGSDNQRRHVLKPNSKIGSGFFGFNTTSTNAAGRSYKIRVTDATMFSAAWSTNPGYNTYFSFYNNTNSTISGTIVLTTTAGAAGGTATLSIPAGRTVPTNTVALGTPASTTGTALFFHDGPVGSIQAESGIANFTFTPPYIQYVTFKQRDYAR